MNIQPTSFTKNHIINNNGPGAHLSQADELAIKKRREDLSRRPSYRKIFNDLTGGGQGGPLDMPQPILAGQLPPPQALGQHRQSPQTGQDQQQQQQQALTSSPSPQGLDLLNPVSVAGSMQTQQQQPQQQSQDPSQTSQSPLSVGDLQTAAAASTQLHQQQLQHSNHLHHHQHPISAQAHHLILTNDLQPHQVGITRHHHHHQHHQHLPLQQMPHQQQQPSPLHQQQQQHHHHHHHQSNQAHQIHQIQGQTSPPLGGGVIVVEEASKKRELRLQKNREAAKECRRKKKEYIKCLENRVAVLENQNKALIDELKTLKDLYCKSTTE